MLKGFCVHKKYLSFFLICVLWSCSHKNFSNLFANESSAYQKINLAIKLGEAKLLKISTVEDTKPLKLVCHQNEVIFQQINNILKAYVAVPLQINLPSFDCTLTYLKNGKELKNLVATVQILDKKFESETLNVPQKTIDLSKKDLDRYFKEKKIISKAYATPNPSPLFQGPFIAPLKSTLTSSYGRKRIYNNQKENQHGGVDFRAAIDTPVPASNSGKIVLAMDLFFSGKTVLIDHGMGIFTMYAHLNKIFAQVGEYVPQNAIIGSSGMTGRVSGPHLHWGVRINEINVDGMEFVHIEH